MKDELLIALGTRKREKKKERERERERESTRAEEGCVGERMRHTDTQITDDRGIIV